MKIYISIAMHIITTDLKIVKILIRNVFNKSTHALIKLILERKISKHGRAVLIFKNKLPVQFYKIIFGKKMENCRRI